MSTPTFIDPERLTRCVRGLDVSRVHAEYSAHGCWDATITSARGGVALEVRLSRFVSDCRSSMRWHADMTEQIRDASAKNAVKRVYIFASADEREIGRCFTIQEPFHDRPGYGMAVFVTAVDSRLTTSRLADLIDTAMRVDIGIDERANGGIGGMAAQFRQLCGVVCTWPREPAARPPSLLSMLREHAPLPIAPASESSVTIAGGTVLVGIVSGDTARRCMLDCLAHARLNGDYLARERAAKASVLARVANAAQPKGRAPAKKVLLVSQETGSDCNMCSEFPEDVTIHLVAGAPVAQIVAHVHAFIHQGFHEVSMEGQGVECLVRNADDAMMAMEERLRVERAEASKTIVRLLGRDIVVKRIKERLWRPGGRLVRDMVDGA